MQYEFTYEQNFEDYVLSRGAIKNAPNQKPLEKVMNNTVYPIGYALFRVVEVLLDKFTKTK